MRLMVVALAISACDAPSRPEKHDPAPAPVIASRADAAVDATAIDTAPKPQCTTSFDCGSAKDPPSDCMHTCVNGTCALFVTIRKEGEACVGVRDGGMYEHGGDPPAGATRLGFCDLAAGLYCDEGTCSKRLGVGTWCRMIDARDDVKCANGLYCDLNAEKCLRAPKVGGACDSSVSNRCALDAYCDPQSLRCKARRKDGAKCEEGAECRSNYCDPETLRCVKQPPTQPCPF
jgi:hypothetical protein